MATSNRIPLSDINALSNWVRFSCNKAGLKVSFENGIPGPYTTDKVMCIPTPNSNMTEEDAIKLRMYVVHECAHHQYGNEVFKLGEDHKLEPGHPLHSIMNLTEDNRIERCAALAYRGDAVSLSAGRRLVSEEQASTVAEQIAEIGGIDKLTDNHARMLALFHEDTDARSDWDVGAVIGMRDFNDTARKSDKVVTNITKLKSVNFAERVRHLASVAESWELTKEIFELLYEQSAEEELEKMKQRAKEGKGEGKEGGTSAGEGDEEGKGKTKAKGKRVGTPEEQLERELAQLLVQSDHTDGAGPISTNQLGLDYTNFDWEAGKTYIPYTEWAEYKFNGDGLSARSTSTSDKGYANDIASVIHEHSVGFPEQVRRLIQVRAATTYANGYKSGKLQQRLLYRRNLPPEVVSEEYRQRLFRRKQENDVLDAAISLLVDCSGSMGGSKYVNAVASASILAHALDGVLHIPVEVLGHTTGMGSRCLMAIPKAFAEPYKADVIKNRFATFAGQMAGNADADAVWFTYNRLCKHKARRKILVVLSDGSPTDGTHGSNPHYGLKSTVKEIHDRKVVEIYGIGIQDANVRNFYPNCFVINRTNELEEGLLGLLRDVLLNKRR